MLLKTDMELLLKGNVFITALQFLRGLCRLTKKEKEMLFIGILKGIKANEKYIRVCSCFKC